jgi:hypothetical protein
VTHALWDRLNVVFRPILREVVLCLQVHPEVGCGLERACEEPGGLRGDAALAVDELVDPLDGNPEMTGDPGLRNFHREQELLEEDLTGVGRDAVLGDHGYS